MQQADSREPSLQALARAGWRLPATPPRLDDAHLREYDHPAERPALAISLAMLAALLALAASQANKEILVGVAAVWLSMLLVSTQAATYNTLRGAEASPTQFPAIHQLVQELRERFKAPPTRVFVVFSPLPEAHAFGFRAPYVIVLHSALLDSLDADELRFILGQQLGHIVFGHTRTAILLGGDESSLPSLLAWTGRLRDLLFGWYRRIEVMSADRAGIVACGSVGVAVRAQVKLAVGAAHSGEMRPAGLVAQAFRLSQGSSRVQAVMITLQSATPPLIPRLRAMVEWAGLPEREEAQ